MRYLLNELTSDLGSASERTTTFVTEFWLSPAALMLSAVVISLAAVASLKGGSSKNNLGGSSNKTDIGDMFSNTFANITSSFSGKKGSNNSRKSNSNGATDSMWSGFANSFSSAAPAAATAPSAAAGSKSSGFKWGSTAATAATAATAQNSNGTLMSILTVLGYILAVIVVLGLVVWVYHKFIEGSWQEVKELVKEATEDPPNLPTSLRPPEVFNIPENDYVYADAKAVCAAYDARLATYKELEDAYNKGAEWCNYGWSEGQMALFPTQQKTFDELQDIPGHENNCGRPGINGGVMPDPKLRFGVNCFGQKPAITDAEKLRMENDPIYPKTAADIAIEEREQYWRSRLPDVLVAPFNHTSWYRW